MFISVKEAMELTGMSSTSIYRLCNKRINTLYVRKEDNKFLIDKEFILATYPPDIVKITEDGEPAIYSSPIQPEIEIKQIEISEKNAPLIIMENDQEVFKQSEISEIIDKSKEFQKSEIKEIVEDSFVTQTNVQNEPIQVIADSQKAEIHANVIDKEKVLAQTGIPLEAKSKKAKIIKWETIIGISASLIIIGLLVYLVYLDVR